MSVISYNFKCGCTRPDFALSHNQKVCKEHKKKLLSVNCKCVDCGEPFTRKPLAGMKKRCDSCQKKFAKANHQKNRSIAHRSVLKGLKDEDYEVTLNDLSAEMGISIERVRQIQNKAANKVLKRYSEEHGNPFRD